MKNDKEKQKDIDVTAAWLMKQYTLAVQEVLQSETDDEEMPEELEPAEGETDILLEDKEQKVQEIHRYRDIVMRWKKGALLVQVEER